jgi:hemerythrin
MLEASYGTSIINMLIEKLSDQSESVILESLNSLQQMMEFLSMRAVIPCLTNLLVKLRPCFDLNNHNIRSLGFYLFNRIISLIPSQNEKVFSQKSYEKDEVKIEEIIRDQIHGHLVSLLLHTNDEKQTVRNSCFKTLIKALIVILDEDVTKYMDEAKNKYGEDYNRIHDDFIANVTRLITEKYDNKVPYHISNCINHFLSSQESIRASSAYLIGIFYEQINSMNKTEVLKSISLENIFNSYAKFF